MKCENCNNEHNGSYGSGRFCSNKCARGFSTKFKRKEINEKISNTLSIDPYLKICPQCNSNFETKQKKQKFCSKKCTAKFNSSNPSFLEKLSKNRIEKIKSGIINGNGIHKIYNFKGEKIRCDSKIEYACLDYFVKRKASSIKRCNFFIQYRDKDKIRRFLPDFVIRIGENIYIVEAKSYMSIKIINEKWRHYNEMSSLKKEVLIEYCENNGFIPFWFTKNLNIKFYNSIK